MLNSEIRRYEWEALTESSAIGIARVSKTGEWLTSNPALCQILGYTAHELAQKTFQDITHPDDLEADLALVLEILDGKRDRYQMDKRYWRKDGNICYARLSVGAVRDANGSFLHFISQIEDVTALKDRTAQLEAVLQAMPATVLVRDRNGICSHILSTNSELAAPVERMVGRSICEIAPPAIAQQIIKTIRKALSRKETERLEYPLLLHDGRRLWFETTITPLNDQEALIIARDNTEAHLKQSELLYLATHDRMTGLRNRAYFIERLEELITQAPARNTHALLLIDVDNLKQINDRPTKHRGGDAAIMAIAQVLQSSTRRADLSARLSSGDEFALLLADISRSAAIERAESIRASVASTDVVCDGSKIPVTISVGVAMFPADGYTFDALYKSADERLMHGKAIARNRVYAAH